MARAGGAALAIATLAHIRIGNFSVYPEPHAQARLVTSGPYAWVRHPMYSALLLLMAGAAGWYAYMANAAGFVLVLAAVVGKARREEACLLDRFGEYDACHQRTHGFIPYLFCQLGARRSLAAEPGAYRDRPTRPSSGTVSTRFTPQEQQSMRIHNLYTDDDGASHFRDIDVEWAEERGTRKYSQRLPATGIIFRETGADYDLDWHPAPRRQYIINLEAGVKITASDGESRVIGPGEVILVEDSSGKGHLSQAVGGQVRHSIFIPIE